MAKKKKKKKKKKKCNSGKTLDVLLKSALGELSQFSGYWSKILNVQVLPNRFTKIVPNNMKLQILIFFLLFFQRTRQKLTSLITSATNILLTLSSFWNKAIISKNCILLPIETIELSYFRKKKQLSF